MNCGKSWANLCLNDTIVSQPWAMGNDQERTNLPEWMRELMQQANEPEVKMVTGGVGVPVWMSGWSQVSVCNFYGFKC